MSHYPKWLYHKTEAAKIVASKDEHEQVGKGWQETPFEVDQEQAETSEQSQASESEAGEIAEATEVIAAKKTKKKK